MNNVTWFAPKRGNSGLSGRAPADYAFSISNYKSGKGAKFRNVAGTIRISAKAMKHLRWIAGDRVLVGLSDDGMDVAIKRVQAGGFTLSAIGGQKENGKTVACCVKSSRFVFPAVATVDMDDFLVGDDGVVMFTLRGKGEA